MAGDDWAATPDFFDAGTDMEAAMRAAAEMFSAGPLAESFRVCPECGCLDENPRREFSDDGTRVSMWCGVCDYQYVKDFPTPGGGVGVGA